MTDEADLHPDYTHISKLPKSVLPTQVAFVPSGSYAVAPTITSDDQSPATTLSSAGFCECMGIVATVKDKAGTIAGHGLAHLVITNDPVTSANNMLRDLHALSPNGSIEIDLIGGYKDFLNSDSFYKEVTDTLKKDKSVTIKNDLMFKLDYSEDITIDLKTGQKFAGDSEQLNQGYIAEALLQNAIALGGAVKQFFNERDKVLEKGLNTPQPAATRLDINTCMPEMAQIWEQQRASILVKLQRDFGAGWKSPG